MESEPDPQRAADQLVRAANRAGGIDNITVVLLDAHDDGEAGGSVAGAGAASSPGTGAAAGRGRRAVGPDRSTLRRWVLRVGIMVLVLAALVVGIRIYADRQWYVGVDHVGHVAVYQGIPASIGGLRFSHVSVSTDLSAAKAEALPVYADLASGITADSRTSALGIVSQIEQDLAGAGTPPSKSGGNSPSPSGAPGSSG
jgi:PPM family protein phosphatase